ATWSSNKWVERAEPDRRLVRIFLGPTENLTATLPSNSSLGDRALKALGDFARVDCEPELKYVSRWIDGLPQYQLGHLDRLAQIEEELLRKPGIHLAGASYRGVGIPDCIRQGREAAA